MVFIKLTFLFFMIHYSLFKIQRRGVIILPTVLMFGGLIVSLAIVGLLIISILNTSNYGARLINAAAVAARAGLQDGLLRASRNSLFTSVGYIMTVASAGAGATADVTVTDCTGLGCPAYPILQKDVISTGTSLNRKKKMQARIQINKNTGAVQVLYIDELGI